MGLKGDNLDDMIRSFSHFKDDLIATFGEETYLEKRRKISKINKKDIKEGMFKSVKGVIDKR